MIHYTCDVCGDPLPDGYERPKGRIGNHMQLSAGADDVCPRCSRVGANMDMPGILLAAWREQVAKEQTPEAAPPGAEAPQDPEPPPRTDAVREEKQKIYGRLKAYRDANGLGSLEAVAKQMRGKEYTALFLLDVVNGTKPLDISVWRKIGKALDKLEGADEQEA